MLIEIVALIPGVLMLGCGCSLIRRGVRRIAPRKGRDLDADAMVTVAERMNDRYPDPTLIIRASRRRSLLRWSVVEGLEVADKWTDVYEPVRKRRMLVGPWEQVQPVQQAASKIGGFMRERPDLVGMPGESDSVPPGEMA